MGALGNGDISTRDGNTPATEIIFDRVCALIRADEYDYPNDALFIAADVPHFGKGMLRALREDRPIVVVFADGRERIIPASSEVAAAS
jgi:hypothetical protein